MGSKDKNLLWLLPLSLWSGPEAQRHRRGKLCARSSHLTLVSDPEAGWGADCYFSVENVNSSHSNGFSIEWLLSYNNILLSLMKKKTGEVYFVPQPQLSPELLSPNQHSRWP